MEHKIQRFDSFSAMVNSKEGQELPRDIDMGEWGIGQDELMTFGASSCLVIAAHNEQTRRGLVGHFSSIAKSGGGEHRHQESFLSAVDGLNRLGNPQDNCIWLGGGAPHVMNGVDESEPERQFAEIAIRRYIDENDMPIPQAKVQWSGPGSVVDIELDCPSGVLSINEYPDALFNEAFFEMLGIRPATS